MTQMTQVNLLQQYATRRDAEAFAKLVEQYQRLIFSTCRRKLHNSQDVDDAVQETFLRLAHRAGELHSNIGGWLHRCAVNVSTDMNRRRAARQKHELAAAAETPAGVENTGVELSELREHLDAALEKLDADQRELIIQRYFLGRQQVDMAEELGVSPSTMTRRLEAAIEAMRGHLQSAGSRTVGAIGAGAVIAAALQAETASAAVPAALTANVMKIGLSGTGATGTTAAAATGGALLGAGVTKALVGVAAALLVTAGTIVAVVKSGGSSAPTPPAPAKQTAIADVAVTIAAAPGNFDAPGAPPRWATSQVAASAAALEGVIRDADGKPIPNATVTLQGNQYQTAKTDAEGRYTFQTINGAGEFRIGVDAAGFVSVQPYRSRDAAIQLTPQSKARRDIVLQRGVLVRVKVTDVTGAGMQNVGVDSNVEGGNYRSQPAERVNTNELGVASITLPVSSSKYVVAASKDEFEPTHALVTPAASDKPIDLELTLLPGLSIKGVALCNDGKPAVGWDISAKPPWWSSNYIPKSATIDAQGNFTLNNVGSGKYELTVWRKNSDGGGTSVMTTTMNFPPSSQPVRLDIPMPSPASMLALSGKVKLIGGGQRPDYVQITAMSGDNQWYHASVRFGARPTPPRRATTRAATRPGAASRPAPSAAANARNLAAVGAAVLLPDEGTFTFDGLPAGVYTIRFESPQIESKSLQNIKVPGGLPDVIELKAVGKPKLTGTVADAETGKPITHFAIRVNKTETIGDGPNYVQDPHWIQVSNPDGKFSVELVGPGVYAAQVSLDGYAWTWSKDVRIDKGGGTGNVEIKVTKGGSLSGQVVDGAGKPVAGAKVIPYSKAKSTANRAEGRFDGDAGAAVTDADGKYTLENLAAGTEKIKIISPRHAPKIIEKLTVVDAKSTPVETIKLSNGGSVEGVVYDERGKPQSGVTLEFQDASGYGGGGDEEAGRLASVTTGEGGKYRVDNLATDQIVFVNIAERWNRQGVGRRVVRPIDGQVAKLDFGGEAKVSGRLVDSKKQPIRGVRIELSVDSPHFGAVMVVSRTDEDGKFAFVGPPPGKYTLYFMPARDERRSEWTAAGKVDVTGKPVDLGEIVNDTGDVVVVVEAEDPADLKKIRHVTASTDQKNRMWQDSIGRATQDAATPKTWKIQDVTPGAFRVTAYLSESNVGHVARGERKPGQAETKLTVRIPKATAALAVSSSATAGANADRGRDYMQLRNETDTVQAYVNFEAAAPKTLPLPPGTYRELDPRTNEPRADVQPIVLKAGETRPFTHTMLPKQPSAGADVTANVIVWQKDGVLAGGDVKLFDPGDKEVESRGGGGPGRLFAVRPGKYKAVFTQPGKPAVTKVVEVAAPADPEAGGRWTPIHVVLD